MSPELEKKVRERWNLGREIQPRKCGCVWVVAADMPYRSRYCKVHGPSTQALLDARTVERPRAPRAP